MVNDIVDKDADRQHPTKRNRPIASGELPENVAKSVTVVIWLIALPAAYIVNWAFGIYATIFLISNLVYSKWLKHVPLIEFIVLASFYVLRVAAGVTLIQVERFSPWLYVFTIFLALYLGIGKRRAELFHMTTNAANTRRVLEGYTIPFLDQLIMVVTSVTIITYSLYTFFAPNLPQNNVMMLTIPFVIYGIFRYLYLVQVRMSGSAPEEVLFTDLPLQATIFFWGIAILIIFYFF
jgi:4-hydroxybenzoate polyprenyltransferase